MRRRRLLFVAGAVAVVGAGVGYAATVGLSSERLTVLSADAPTTTTSTSTSTTTTSTTTTSTTVPANDMAITLANGSGATADKADKGDSVTITFNPAVKSETFCSSWTGNAASFNLGEANNAVIISVTNGAGSANDTLSVTGFGATCANGFRLGIVDLGSPAYVTANVEFKGNESQGDRSSVVWTPGTKAMVLVLGGSNSSSRGTVTAAATTTFTPDSNLRDVNNIAVTGTATTTTKF